MTVPINQDELGGRLALLAPEDLDEDQRPVYDALSRTVVPEAAAGRFTARLDDGRFVGPFNALLRAPAIAAAMGGWTAATARAGLGEDVRQVAILTVGTRWGAEYEIDAHRHAALEVGIRADDVEAIVAGREPQGLTAPALLSHRLTAVLLDHHAVPDTIYTEAVATFGEAGLVALLHLIGQYQTISSILVTFHVPVPVQAVVRPTTHDEDSDR